MQLYYCKYPDGRQNFGDALNPWMWQQLLPDIINDEDDGVTFVGIGTLIHEALPRRTSKAKKRVIFGTGAGFPGSEYKSMPQIDDSYTIYSLRGPLSAKALQVSETLAITDGAILVRRLFDYHQPKKYRFSYMPHYNFAGEGWAQVCQNLGFGYIDPSSPVEESLALISQTEILLTEAMHGAILADAFGVPWIPIKTDPSILDFKWQDWCLSVGVEYQPVSMSRYHQPRGTSGGWSKTDLSSKDLILKPVRQVRDWLRQKQVMSEFLKIVQTVKPTLSKDDRTEQLTRQTEDKLEQFKQDVKEGKFQVYSKL
ncbi:polysaccharide pyruvyl transferase family protein [Chroococcus sp. FPU101]|uniref:polysaccharide pyruvyl transferase family protein n=1 Tax=Chroococcus sp. FPU101 TaxID=1974212 RepID=UPI001AA753FC|nr:polysaccharide pyruvyl transferase family protein [Chroococcus sp. FPU101]GFE68170.1 succinoglycan biosynthesis ketolase [Chroococcus sp. FPU101]